MWVNPRYLASYAIMGVLVMAAAFAVVFNARHPRPLISHPPNTPPEWRCVNQTRGGPICYRALPAAAKPPPSS